MTKSCLQALLLSSLTEICHLAFHITPSGFARCLRDEAKEASHNLIPIYLPASTTLPYPVTSSTTYSTSPEHLRLTQPQFNFSCPVKIQKLKEC